MKIKKKFIIFGSNFGSNTHLEVIKKLNKKNLINICSPHIKTKKKFLSFETFKNYNEALKNKFDFITIATPPLIQKKICKKILDNKIKTNYILLEKPISENFKETKKIITRLSKNKIKFLVNFIFVNIPSFIKLNKLLNKKEISCVKYSWFFKQKYFVNKKKTWKTDHKIGGGIINYYLIHIFYNLLFYFEELNIVDIKFKKTGRLITSLNLFMTANNNIQVQIKININSKMNEHGLLFETKKDKYHLINKSNDWVNNFNLYANDKKINIVNNQTDRTELTLKNYNKLLSGKYSKKTELNKTLKAHELCEIASNKLDL